MTDGLRIGDFDVPPSPADPARSSDDKPALQIATDPAAMRDLTGFINLGYLPDVYVTNGALVHLSKVSGDVSIAGLAPDEAPPMPYASTPLTAAGLSLQCAHHLFLYRQRKDKDGNSYTEEATLKKEVFNSVLSQRYWPDVRPLHGIIGAPALRPDGSLLQTAGYDLRTGLYYAPKVDMPRIPDRPSIEEVTEAREFLLNRFLRDFLWVDENADRANYIGLLVTPILRPYVRSVIPFGLINATTQGSGKTILSDGIGQLFGQKVQPWDGSNTELRKNIPGVLDQPAPIIVFDNVKEGSIINQPVLAMLLTSTTFSDRVLGANTNFSATNDKLWMATGNNIRLGGDMATRTVLVQLDPKMPHPEMRTGFSIPNLERWIKEPANQRILLRHLLILVMDWIAAGGPRADHTMRQFSTWASAVGGFLDYHGINGFLGNIDTMRSLDDEDAMWATFLDRWHDFFGDTEKTAGEVRKHAEIQFLGDEKVDPWDGDFVVTEEGKRPSSHQLGHMLGGQVGRYHGQYVVRRRQDNRKRTFYRVDVYEEQGG